MVLPLATVRGVPPATLRRVLGVDVLGVSEEPELCVERLEFPAFKLLAEPEIELKL